MSNDIRSLKITNTHKSSWDILIRFLYVWNIRISIDSPVSSIVRWRMTWCMFLSSYFATFSWFFLCTVKNVLDKAFDAVYVAYTWIGYCCAAKWTREKRNNTSRHTHKTTYWFEIHALRQHCIKEQSNAFFFSINIIVNTKDGCSYYAAMHFSLSQREREEEKRQKARERTRGERWSWKMWNSNEEENKIIMLNKISQ